MKSRFKNYISEQKLFKPSDKVLLAVSGGMDSMLLFHLMLECGYHIEVAHCNFNLRPDEASKDEEFIRETASRSGTPFYSKSFDTEEYSKNEGISLQMAARELRYNWFEELLEKNNSSFLATAHHLNDVAETMLLNLSKGTGIAGLHGIKNKTGNIIRPLLFLSKSEIAVYVKEKEIPFREDSSNASIKYQRNKIRHEVIPLLKEINPALIQSFSDTASIISGTEKVFQSKVNEEKNKAFTEEKGEIQIDLEHLKSLPEKEVYLFHWLKPFEFQYPVIREIISNLDNQPGKVFHSQSHTLLKDRKALILREKEVGLKHETPAFIHETTVSISFPMRINFHTLLKKELENIPTDPAIACFDFEKLDFPLKLRKWQEGDFFYPLGMKGKKKLSDFFTDEKLSLFQKEKVWVLTNATGEILWIPNYRIDNRFRLTDRTRKVFFARIT